MSGQIALPAHPFISAAWLSRVIQWLSQSFDGAVVEFPANPFESSVEQVPVIVNTEVFEEFKNTNAKLELIYAAQNERTQASNVGSPDACSSAES